MKMKGDQESLVPIVYLLFFFFFFFFFFFIHLFILFSICIFTCVHFMLSSIQLQSAIQKRRQFTLLNISIRLFAQWNFERRDTSFLPNCMCAQQRQANLSECSGLSSTQADQGVFCLSEDALDPWLPTERYAKTLIRLGTRNAVPRLEC